MSSRVEKSVITGPNDRIFSDFHVDDFYLALHGTPECSTERARLSVLDCAKPCSRACSYTKGAEGEAESSRDEPYTPHAILPPCRVALRLSEALSNCWSVPPLGDSHQLWVIDQTDQP